MTGIRYNGGTAAPRVLVTRPAEDAAALTSALAQAGCEPVVVPLLERAWCVEAVADLAEREPRADWVIVTSATAAEVVATAAPQAWRTARWAAVGNGTAGRLAALGYRVGRVPETATAADLVTALGDLGGATVVYPRADLAAPATLDALRAAGARVLDVVAYENRPPTGHEARLRAALPVDATTLLSASAAERAADAVPRDQWPALGRVVVIGPSTAAAAASRGLPVHAMAEPHSVAGVVAQIRRLFDLP